MHKLDVALLYKKWLAGKTGMVGLVLGENVAWEDRFRLSKWSGQTDFGN